MLFSKENPTKVQATLFRHFFSGKLLQYKKISNITVIFAYLKRINYCKKKAEFI